MDRRLDLPDANGHIQATGRDDKGRKQYRYHPRWREVRDDAKYDHMLAFGPALPGIRARVAADLKQPGMPREKVLATVVRLLETTLIRVGNEEYAKQNSSFGLTTLRDRHVEVNGAALRFSFRGKSGKTWRLGVQDRRVARIVRQCQELPGQELFQYLDEDGEVARRRARPTSTSTCARSPARSSPPRISAPGRARCWRRWRLRECERFATQAAAKRNIRAAIEPVAARLGNTPTVCRKCYVHPEILDCYLDEALILEIAAEAKAESDSGALRPDEEAVLALLQQRLKRMEKEAAYGGAGAHRSGARQAKLSALCVSPLPLKRASSGKGQSGRVRPGKAAPFARRRSGALPLRPRLQPRRAGRSSTARGRRRNAPCRGP